MPSDTAAGDDATAAGRCKEWYDRACAELGKVVVGQQRMIEQVLIALLARGHALVEGVPGLAKSLLLESLGAATGLTSRRVQLTSDLVPDDVTGTETLRQDASTGRPAYQFLPGPLFANLILADDINRTPPKTQAAVLQAMQDRHVTVGGNCHPLPNPFFLLATQNPLEHEGTFPLPPAQLDRFLLFIKVDYPSGEEEWELARRVTMGKQGALEPLMTGEDLIAYQNLVARVPVSDPVLGYAWALGRASRPQSQEAPEFVDRWVARGAGPRGVLALIMSAKARAFLHGRCRAQPADVQALALPVLRHRIAGNDAAQANALGSETLVEMLLEAVRPDDAAELFQPKSR